MKNKLTDLNDILFAQLERLADEDATAEKIDSEIKRTAAIVQVADKIVDNASLQLSAMKLVAEHKGLRMPMLGIGAGTPEPQP